jgi:pimeloyl-ACP methyl ester carboxylesterase
MKAAAILLAMAATMMEPAYAADNPARQRQIVGYDDVKIDLISEGQGSLIVLLPSRGRDSEDFNEVAAGLAAKGFRVLRPQPRGAEGSTGPMENVRMQDLARDVAFVIEHENAGPAIVAGHAYGNWVARMTAVDHTKLVRGVVLMAAAAKTYPAALRDDVQQSGNLSLPDAQRLEALRRSFFAPTSDATIWLKGWAPAANKIQGSASTLTKQAEYWQAAGLPMLDIVPELDPFKPADKRNESREEFGSRVTVVTVPNASHALIPENPKAVVEAIATWAKTIP